MLDQLLQILAEGGTHTYAELADDLGVGEVLLQQMIDDLARMGYLRAVGDGCQAECGQCSLAGICAVGGRARVWGLTEKGSQVAGRLQ